MGATHLTIGTNEGVAQVAFEPQLIGPPFHALPRIMKEARGKSKAELRETLREMAKRWSVSIAMDGVPID